MCKVTPLVRAEWRFYTGLTLIASPDSFHLQELQQPFASGILPIHFPNAFPPPQPLDSSTSASIWTPSGELAAAPQDPALPA